jgi:hypothetical protein
MKRLMLLRKQQILQIRKRKKFLYSKNSSPLMKRYYTLYPIYANFINHILESTWREIN